MSLTWSKDSLRSDFVKIETEGVLRGIKEDFGKRNMPGKRARRYFSKLSDFESGMILRMKTADWTTRSIAAQVDHSECAVRNCWEQWTRVGSPRAENWVWNDQEDHEERGSKDHAAST
ncbi:uncharacterized protein TNCV_1535121 [Trichonephila clavipes]|uniref:Uncharacterized protein n=1 Tax=Trichonephila clavipes TaxID=2585209 RepID=A0A8X6RG84_TRICX|nr:uncharacterized protein TNCV_1535121 [Trichonephila clavipes]